MIVIMLHERASQGMHKIIQEFLYIMLCWCVVHNDLFI